jgi:hypothetical protein
MTLMAESKQSSSSKLERDAVALGKTNSKTAFPNPNREGCPDRTRLRAMARRDRSLTLKDLPVSHVVSCSPCFREYTRFRRILLLVRASQVTAALLAVFAIGLLAVRLVRNSPRDQSNSSQVKPLVVVEQTPHPIEPVPIRVDLASFSPTRGDDAKDDSGNKVHFPQKLIRVIFLLPVGMEPGEYAIRLQDSSGQVFAEQRAQGRINAGTTSLEVKIDLSGASPGTFTLMVQPPGLSWRKFPVVVE